jgi:hypothetical protein
VARRNLVAVLLFEPDLCEVLRAFHCVIGLQVVDDTHVVDVLSTSTDVPMSVLLARIVKCLNQRI